MRRLICLSAALKDVPHWVWSGSKSATAANQLLDKSTNVNAFVVIENVLWLGVAEQQFAIKTVCH